MGYDVSIYGGYSGRPAYRIRLYVRRDLTDWANNKSSYAWALYADKVSSGTTYELNPQPWAVQVGTDHFSGATPLDFRSTNTILLSSNTTNFFSHDAAGYLNFTIAANSTPGGLFGAAYTSGTFSADRIPKPPDAPTMGGATNITTSSYRYYFSGNDSGGSAIVGYQLQWATDAGFTVNAGTTTTTSSPVDIMGRAGNTTYYNRVRAWNNASGGVTYGAWSSTLAVTTLNPATAPPAPGMSGITGVSWDRLTVNWYSTGNGGSAITSTRLELSTDPGFASPTVVTDPGTSYQFTGLAPSTTYYARVRQVNAVGTGAWSSTVSASTIATPVPPSAPTITALSGIGPTSIVVEFQNPTSDGGSPITGWELQWDNEASFTGPWSTSPNSYAFTVGSLNDGTQYWFRVRAINAWGNGAWSNVATASTLAAVFVGKSDSYQYAQIFVGKDGAFVPAEIFVGSGGSFVSPT